MDTEKFLCELDRLTRVRSTLEQDFVPKHGYGDEYFIHTHTYKPYVFNLRKMLAHEFAGTAYACKDWKVTITGAKYRSSIDGCQHGFYGFKFDDGGHVFRNDILHPKNNFCFAMAVDYEDARRFAENSCCTRVDSFLKYPEHRLFQGRYLSGELEIIHLNKILRVAEQAADYSSLTWP